MWVVSLHGNSPLQAAAQEVQMAASRGEPQVPARKWYNDIPQVVDFGFEDWYIHVDLIFTH